MDTLSVQQVQGGESFIQPASKGFASEFADMLKQNISDTNSLLNTADTTMKNFTVNQSASLHEVMIAVEEASVALNYTMQVRNRLIEAYQELMRVQV